MREEFDCQNIEYRKDRVLEQFLKIELKDLQLEIFTDDYLLFWKQHFDDWSWATYDNGQKKGATIRYKDNTVRIPANILLPVYESNEFKEDYPPRALVSIDKVIIATPNEFTKDELMKDGFTSPKDMVTRMKIYYPNINNKSVISYYQFGNAIFHPPEAMVDSYFKNHPKK